MGPHSHGEAAEAGIEESVCDEPLMSLWLIFYADFPGTHGRGSSRQKYSNPAPALHALSWSSGAISVLFPLLLLLEQTQSQLYWWSHCHGFGELRSVSAQLEVEFPAMTFITVVVIKYKLFGLFFWQSSAEMQMSAIHFWGQQTPLLHELVFFSLSVIISLFSC